MGRGVHRLIVRLGFCHGHVDLGQAVLGIHGDVYIALGAWGREAGGINVVMEVLCEGWWCSGCFVGQ